MKTVSANTSRYNVILVKTEREVKKKLNEKIIKLELKNGKEVHYFTNADEDNNAKNFPSLKELQAVEDWVVKNRAQIINKQKDEANKLKVGIGKIPFDAIVLPDDAPPSLVIRFLNDLHVDFTRDDIKVFWSKYRQKIHTMEI